MIKLEKIVAKDFFEEVIARLKYEKEIALAPLKKSQIEYKKNHIANNKDITYEIRKVSKMYNDRVKKFQRMFLSYSLLMQMSDDELRLHNSNKNGRFGESVESILSYAELANSDTSIELRKEIVGEVIRRKMKESDYQLYKSGRKKSPEVDPASIKNKIFVKDTGQRPKTTPAIDITARSLVLPSRRSPKYWPKESEDDYSEDSSPDSVN